MALTARANLHTADNARLHGLLKALAHKFGIAGCAILVRTLERGIVQVRKARGVARERVCNRMALGLILLELVGGIAVSLVVIRGIARVGRVSGLDRLRVHGVGHGGLEALKALALCFWIAHILQ